MTVPQFGKTAVYRLYDADETLIYVGVASSPESRFRDHARDKPWWPKVVRKAITWRDSRDEALTEEFETIRDLSPFYNQVAWEPRPSGRSRLATPGTQVPVRVLRDNLGRRIDEAHYRGEVTVIEKNGEARAALVPLEWFKQHYEEPDA